MNGAFTITDRARGCLLGQLAGDSLGSLVEFRGRADIAAQYPGGVRDMAAGGTFNNIAGQVTDDSEMALAMARTIVRLGHYDASEVLRAYVRWARSGPFDIGRTTSRALGEQPDPFSQANGALMRVSPLGIFCAGMQADEVSQLAALDASLTHPNQVCVDANRIFVVAIARAIKDGPGPVELYELVLAWGRQAELDPTVIETVVAAAQDRPADYLRQQGWVLIALQNAFWQMLHAPDPETGIIDTIMQGGDTDTNACICGALLGAVHGARKIPERWIDVLKSCRPEAGRPGVKHPRPPEYWPIDVIELADALVAQ